MRQEVVVGVLEAWMCLLNRAAKVLFEDLHGFPNNPTHLGFDGCVAPVRTVDYLQASHTSLRCSVEVRRWPAVAIPVVGTGHYGEHEGAIAHRAAQGAYVLQGFPA